MRLEGVSMPVTRRTVVTGGCAVVATAVAGYAYGRIVTRDGSTGGAASGTVLGSTADIPVGGGAVVAEHEVVVTQPTSGVFRAFSAICTHRGCTVNDVVDGTIHCPCHGSQFDIADGSVVGGPAQRPLAKIEVTVTDAAITLV